MSRKVYPYLIFLLVLTAQVEIYSQTLPISERYSIIKKKKGKKKRITVEITEKSDTSITYYKLNESNIYSLKLNQVKKVYNSDEVKIYNKSKFHYKNGILLNFGLGIGGNSSSFNISINKRFSNSFEFGLGTGTFRNNYFLPINSNNINVVSIPIFASGKFIINKGKRAWYTKGQIGYTFNQKTFNLDHVENGILIEPSIGVTLSSKRRIKHYFQLSQNISHASGSFTFQTPNESIPTTGSFDIWFNGTFFTYGIEIGR
jgi:hypothetical protein